jgi:hypothetical protein
MNYLSKENSEDIMYATLRARLSKHIASINIKKLKDKEGAHYIFRKAAKSDILNLNSIPLF